MFAFTVSLCLHKILPPQSPLSVGYMLLTNWTQDQVCEALLQTPGSPPTFQILSGDLKKSG